jgi:uncharacterized membrane protein
MHQRKISTRTRSNIYWVATILVALAFFVTGIGNLIPIEHIAHDMLILGYPKYFLLILGTWKILGALTLVVPRTRQLKEWAYAGMLFDLTGAALSRLATGTTIVMVVVPALVACLVMISWVYRPESRRLAL